MVISAHTLWNVSLLTNYSISLIISFKWATIQVLWEYTMFFTYPHRMKSHGVKFGLLGGHSIGSPRPIHLVEHVIESIPNNELALHPVENSFLDKIHFLGLLRQDCPKFWIIISDRGSLLEIVKFRTDPVCKNCLIQHLMLFLRSEALLNNLLKAICTKTTDNSHYGSYNSLKRDNLLDFFSSENVLITIEYLSSYK